MISLTAFHMAGAQLFTRLDDLREDALLPFRTPTEARAELLPLFPTGTRWPEHSAKGAWNGTDGGWMEIKVDLPHSALIHTWSIDGEVFATMRRIYDTDRWLLVLLEEGEVFHPYAVEP